MAAAWAEVSVSSAAQRSTVAALGTIRVAVIGRAERSLLICPSRSGPQVMVQRASTAASLPRSITILLAALDTMCDRSV